MKTRTWKIVISGTCLFVIGAVVLALMLPTGGIIRHELVSTPTESLARQFEFALEIYRSEHGHYPETSESLARVVEPYFPGSTDDLWGRPFRFVLVNGKPKVFSAGPDGNYGTTDDIYGAPPRCIERRL